MGKIFSFMLLFTLCYSQQVITFISESFESGSIPSGWRKSQNASSIGWMVGTTSQLSSSFFYIPPRDGFVLVDNDDACGQNCDGSIDVVDTPPFTQDPTLGECFVQFDSYFTGDYSQRAFLLFSVNGTNGPYRNWQELPPNDPFTADWQTLRFVLPQLPATSSVSIRFWSSDSGQWAGGWAIDNVLIGQNDWTGIVPGCPTLLAPSNGSAIPVERGALSWQGSGARFPFGYYVHFGTDFPPTNVASHLDVRRATSYTPPSLVANQTYYFQVIPYGKDNLQPSSCPVWNFIASLPPATTPTSPYFEDFEKDNGNWFAGGSLSTWAYGTPNKPTIHTTKSGTKAWLNGGLTSTYNNREQSYLQSPNFDFSNVTNSIFASVWILVDTETSYDGAKFQYLLNDTWKDLGAFGDENWYNDYSISGLPILADGWTGLIAGWTQVAHFLPNEILGQSQVAFRFFFGADNSVNKGGFAIDDFSINAVPLENPLCPLNVYPIHGDNDLATKLNLIWSRDLTERILLPQGFYLKFGTDNPPSNIFNSTNVGIDYAIETPDLTPLATYYWQLVPYGFEGAITTNCPIWNFTVSPVEATFPYTEDFESGEGGWAPLGSGSTWAFGYPNKTTIRGCGSGSFCWVNGGLTGNYANNENDYVISPQFNFSSLQYDPFIVLKVFWETEKDYDGANVQYQRGDGTWKTIGTPVDGTNWYTSSIIRSNPGNSTYGWCGRNGVGSNRWVVATNELVGLAGVQTRFRISFASDLSLVDDGFAFDDIKIVPAPVGVVPSCAIPVYPPNNGINVPVSGAFNLQWTTNETTVGLPRGYYIKYGLTNPPTRTFDLGILSTYPVVNASLSRGTTYYWQAVPYGYNDLQAANCPVWSFTTVPNPTSAPTSSPSYVTSASPQTSVIRTSTATQPRQSTSPNQNQDSSSSTGPSKGSVAAAVIIPILVFIIIVIVGIFLYSKYSKKSRAKRSKLQQAERELDERATSV